jgi:hypothetical protein
MLTGQTNGVIKEIVIKEIDVLSITASAKLPPGMPVLKLSAKTGEGMENYLEFLATRLSELRTASTV